MILLSLLIRCGITSIIYNIKQKDILYDMSCIKKELETGLMDMTYSTVADDYSENRGAMDSGTIDRTPDENTQ